MDVVPAAVAVRRTGLTNLAVEGAEVDLSLMVSAAAPGAVLPEVVVVDRGVF